MKQTTSASREPSPADGSESDDPQTETTEKGSRPKGLVFIRAERCKGCSFCVTFCPKNVLEMGTAINEKGYHLPAPVRAEDCTGCNNCGVFCPDFAIFGIREADLVKVRAGSRRSAKSSCDNGGKP